MGRSFNALRMSGTEFPPNLLMATRLLSLSFILTRNVFQLPDGFLPFITPLGYFNGSDVYRYALELGVIVATTSLWFNRAVRTCCSVIGCTVLLELLASQPYYGNNLLYFAIFFLLAGLYDDRFGMLLFRLQLAVIYFGAGLNKLLDPDWRSGAFMQDWMHPDHFATGGIYSAVASIFPGHAFPILLSWLAIATELSMVPLVLIPRLTPLAIVAGVSFHTGLVLITGGVTFNMFWFAAVATFLAFMRWPTGLVVNYDPSIRLHAIAHATLSRADLDRTMEWCQRPAGQLEIDDGQFRYTGAAGLARILLYTPAFYVGCVVVFAIPYIGSKLIPFVTYVLIAGVVWGYTQRLRRTRSAPDAVRS